MSLECDDREQRRKGRLVRDAGFPRPKRIEDFDFGANPHVPAALIHTLARSAWVAAGQLDQARLVASLRQIGVPLAQIKVVLGLDARASRA